MILERWDHKGLYAALGVDGRHTTLAGTTLLRDKLAEAQNWRCCYCGIIMNRWRNCDTLCTIEHVIPASAGGRVCWETCAAACKKCNVADGARIVSEGQMLLNVPLCAFCGSDDVRMAGRFALKCRDCGKQYSEHYDECGPLRPVKFSALRRATGEMIVANADAERIADRLRRTTVRVNFLPVRLAETLMRMADPLIEASRLKSDCQVEIYDHAISGLRAKYTPETAAAPKRGPLAGIAGVGVNKC